MLSSLLIALTITSIKHGLPPNSILDIHQMLDSESIEDLPRITSNVKEVLTLNEVMFHGVKEMRTYNELNDFHGFLKSQSWYYDIEFMDIDIEWLRERQNFLLSC